MRIFPTLSSAAAWGVALAAAGFAGALARALPAQAADCPGNPNALGTSRVIPIDFADYQRVGTLNYPRSVPLADHEVVLTFDDGPLPPYTNQILATLAAQCVKANYFMVGSMARAYPDAVRRVHDAGHTIGTHSQTHPLRMGSLPVDKMDWQIDQGIANVSAALGDPSELAPFFRIPGFARSNLLEQELAARQLVVFSTDVVADDWHRGIKPAKIISLAISRLEKRGRGILLLHDIHPATAAALPGLLQQLKEHGFHIVQVVPAAPGVPPVMTASAGETAVWPAANSEPASDAIELAAPAADTFMISLTTGASPFTAPAAAAATAPNDDAAVWPSLAALAVPAAAPQLAAPSIADIGLPPLVAAAPDSGLRMRQSVDLPRPVHSRHHAHAAKLPQHADLMGALIATLTPTRAAASGPGPVRF
jgi:peptidoglycan/xylan/chitin deacetylase (PgdA/CDA1 family)